MAPSYATKVLLVAFISSTAFYSVRAARIQAVADPSICNALTCDTFEESADSKKACSCIPFVGSPELGARVNGMMHDVLQNLRYLTDKLAPDANMFKRVWHGRSLGSSQGDIGFIEEVLKHTPEQAKALDVPVVELGNSELTLPAGVMPVMVEVWHQGKMSHDFLGETGVPLIVGTHEHTKRLMSNPNRGSKAVSGTVTFTTEVSKSERKDCKAVPDMKCLEISVAVRCGHANGIAVASSTFGDHTDAYCKVRVKKDAQERSSKDNTEVVRNSLDPVFPANEFLHQWEEVLIEPMPVSTSGTEVVPDVGEWRTWTLDQMTVSEQIHANMYYLLSKIFLKENSCEHAKVPAMCKLVEKFGTLTVDTEALQEVAASMPNNGPVKKLLAAEGAEAASFASLIEKFDQRYAMSSGAVSSRAELGMVHVGAIHAARRANQRRTGGSGAGFKHGGGRKSTVPPLLFVAFIVLIIVLLAA